MAVNASGAANASNATNTRNPSYAKNRKQPHRGHHASAPADGLCKLGMGGDLFVQGDHESIQAVRRLMADCASLHRRNEIQFARLLCLQRENRGLQRVGEVLGNTLRRVQRQSKTELTQLRHHVQAWEDAAHSLHEKSAFLEGIIVALCAPKHRFWRVLCVLILGK